MSSLNSNYIQNAHFALEFTSTLLSDKFFNEKE